jgi:ABC-type nickel/cobalt efflux system permease component RcnA
MKKKVMKYFEIGAASVAIAFGIWIIYKNL